jgi:hypothetical protein
MSGSRVVRMTTFWGQFSEVGFWIFTLFQRKFEFWMNLINEILYQVGIHKTTLWWDKPYQILYQLVMHDTVLILIDEC